MTAVVDRTELSAADAVLTRYIEHTDLWAHPSVAEARVLPVFILTELGLPERLYDRVAALWDTAFRSAIGTAVEQAREHLPAQQR